MTFAVRDCAPPIDLGGEMKRLLLVGTAFVALAASGSAARATPFDFTYTGSLVTFMVPTTDTYQILAFGAQGGAGSFASFVGTGGLGAEIGGTFGLTAGEVLQIAVGGAGMPGEAGGGGGGTFVIGPGNTPLVIAGGGGGGGHGFPGTRAPGQGGLIGPDGGGPGGGTGGNGGGGAGGLDNSFPGGGGGGGFFSAGTGSAFAGGGGAFPGLAGGSGNASSGGFGGGGGGGSGVKRGGGGGGGGYSGGGGGHFSSMGNVPPGGGGGSFDAGTDQILVADFQTGNGEVVITDLAAAVPEPASLALVGAGLIGFAVISRRRRPGR
jgi:hypothetical protein